MLDALYTGVRSALNVAAVNAYVSGRIYKKQAPGGAQTPFIRYYISAGGLENITAATMLNALVTVECISTADKQATDLFDEVFNILHYGELTITGWNNFWMAAEQVLDLPPENYNGVQYYRVGADFRIRADKTA